MSREEFRLCLDSFHFAAKLWGDPFVESGKRGDEEERLAESLSELVRECPLEQLFYLQLSDGERLDPPYSKEHPWYGETRNVGDVWSNEARPFPMEVEYGAYMPVEAITRAVLVELGYKGWVSLETFDRRMRMEESSPHRNAERARKSWETLKAVVEPGNGKLSLSLVRDGLAQTWTNNSSRSITSICSEVVHINLIAVLQVQLHVTLIVVMVPSGL